MSRQRATPAATVRPPASAGGAAQCCNAHFFVAPNVRVDSPRTSPTHQLLVIQSGTYNARWPRDPATTSDGHTTRNTELAAGPHDVVYMPAHLFRRETNDPDTPTHCICIYFHWPAAPQDLPYKIHDQDGLIRTLADLLMQAKTASSPRRQFLMDGYLAAILAEYIRQAELRDDKLPARIRRFTLENMCRRFTLDDLATHVGLNKHHLGRHYHKLTGHSPMDDVRRMRADHALGVIRSQPQTTLKEVAPKVALVNAVQVSKLLKRYLHLSIRQVRQSP